MTWTMRSGRVVNEDRETMGRGMLITYDGDAGKLGSCCYSDADAELDTSPEVWTKPLTPDERAEIADIVCEAWRKWAETGE